MKSTQRFAFTLIELLVVMSLIVVLGSLAVMFVPRMSEQQRAARGGGQVQQYLITAQNQALRSQAPYGLRFYVKPDGSLQCDEMQFILQPDDFTGGTLKAIAGSSPATATISNIDVANGNSADRSLWAVQKGDYLELFGGGLVRRVDDINETPVGSGQFVISFITGTSFDFSVDTSEYRIIRKPRVAGDEAVKLPDDIIIDFKTNADYGNTLAPNYLSDGTTIESYDIVFGPAGNVIGSQMGTESIILWVRDATQQLDEGEPTLITIYSRTGAIEAHPVNTNGDPYLFTKDGRSSGG